MSFEQNASFLDTGVQDVSLHGRQSRIVPRIHYPPFKKADFNRQPFFCSFYNDMKLYYAEHHSMTYISFMQHL